MPRFGSRALQLVKILKAVVAHALLKPAVEKPAHPDVFGSGAAEIDIRGAQDSLALVERAIGKRERKVLEPDLHVPPIEQIGDEPARDSDRIEDEVGNQTERVQHRDHQVVQRAAARTEHRRPARGRLVLAGPIAGGVGALAELADGSACG